MSILYETQIADITAIHDKNINKKIVFTNGCFDIIHIGHISYLRKSRSMGDILVVGLNSDDSVRKLKGDGRPINNEIHRAEILSEMRSVDHVIIFNDSTPIELMKRLKPDIYTKGNDYSRLNIPEKSYMDKMGKKTIFVDLVNDISSTKIINKAKL